MTAPVSVVVGFPEDDRDPFAQAYSEYRMAVAARDVWLRQNGSVLGLLAAEADLVSAYAMAVAAAAPETEIRAAAQAVDDIRLTSADPTGPVERAQARLLAAAHRAARALHTTRLTAVVS